MTAKGEPRPRETETPTIRGETPPPGGAPGPAAPEAWRPAGERYAIERELGRGGMGVVYRAVDRDLERPVALKVIRHDGDAAHAARFVEEARAAARLEHPSIVPVYDVGLDASGRPYFAMKLVEGRTLAEARAELSMFRRLQAVIEVARAVAYAHERGLIHRDLKPQNVMIGRHGEVLVMDWGLARRLDAGSGSGERAVAGTPGYMAPEQLEGRPAGPAADVYALGALLHHALTGTPPGGSSNRAEALARALGPAPAPSATDPSVAPELDAICAKALAPRPEDRYAGAEALAHDIESFLEHRPVSAYDEPLLARAARWMRRNRGLVRATAAVLVGIALAGIVTARRERDATEARLRTQAEQAAARLAEPGLALEARLGLALDALQAASQLAAIAPEPENRRRAFEASMALARLAMQAEQWGLATSTLEKARGLDVDEARARAALADAERGRTRVLDEHRAAIEAVLADARSGRVGATPGGYEDALFTLVTYREPQTVSLLADALDGLTATLRTVTAVAEPAVPPFTAYPLRPIGPRDELAAAQTTALGDTGALVARLACDALGRIGIRDRAVPALAGYLAAEEHEVRAASAGVALARLRGHEAYAALEAGYSRFPSMGTFSTRTKLALRGTDFGSHIDASTTQGLLDRTRARQIAGALDEALADAIEGTRRAPHLFEAWFRLGSVRRVRVEPEAAIEAYTKAVELRPDNPIPLRARGAVFTELGRDAEAMRDFDRAHALAPDDPEVLSSRAQLKSDMDDFSGAIADLDRAIRMPPSDSDLWTLRANARYLLGDDAEAIADASRAVAMNPADDDAYSIRGEARANLGKLDEALADHDRAVAIQPEDPWSWYQRGRTRRAAGDRRGALADFDRAIALDPSRTPDFLSDRADLRLDMGDRAGAIADWDRAIEYQPDAPEHWFDRALGRNFLDDHDGALADVNRAIELDPKYAVAFALRAQIRRNRGELEEGIADARRAIKLDPASELGHSEMAHIHEAKKDLDGALVWALRAQKAWPGGTDALEAVARVRMARGEAAEARAALEALIAVDPQHAFAKEELERMRAAETAPGK